MLNHSKVLNILCIRVLHNNWTNISLSSSVSEQQVNTNPHTRVVPGVAITAHKPVDFLFMPQQTYITLAMWAHKTVLSNILALRKGQFWLTQRC